MLDPIPDDVLAQLQEEWNSKACPICHAEKWAYYPFCRRCRIILTRNRMNSPFFDSYGGKHWKAILRYLRQTSGDERLAQRFARVYDCARDFLGCHARGLVIHRKSEEE